MTPKPSYAPTWLPLPSKPWRLVDVRSGSFWPRPLREGTSKAFETAEDALRFARKYKVELSEDLTPPQDEV